MYFMGNIITLTIMIVYSIILVCLMYEYGQFFQLKLI